MKEYTDIGKDLQIIEDFLVDEDNPNSFSSMCKKMDISETDYLAIKNDELEPTKQQLENIYNYAYARNLYLNEITWQECLDEYRHNGVEVCTHGARTYLKGEISLYANGLDKDGKALKGRSEIAAYSGGESNDFSYGFYIGQDIAQAGMFVGEEPNSSLYLLTFDSKPLNCAEFGVDLDWMLAIGLFRGKLDDYLDHPKLQEIKAKVDNCDYVSAPIADNKIFEVIDAFVTGKITDLQCLYSLSATHLGYQYVLKTQKALDHLEIIKHLYYCGLEKSLYNKESDIETNTSNQKALIARKRYKGQGKFISEILQ